MRGPEQQGCFSYLFDCIKGKNHGKNFMHNTVCNNVLIGKIFAMDQVINIWVSVTIEHNRNKTSNKIGSYIGSFLSHSIFK